MNELDKSALINNECTIKTKIIINGSTVLTESDYILSWDYEDFRYVPNQGFIGQFVERVVNGKLKNVDDSFTLENKLIELQFAVVRNDGTETWYSLGLFIVNNPTDDNVKDNTSFKAVDYTKYFETPYTNRLTYPTTAFALAYDVCRQSKTSLGNSILRLITKDNGKPVYTRDTETGVLNFVENPNFDSTTQYFTADECFTNQDFIIPNNQFVNNETCRDVMKAIGMLAYSWVRIGWDNRCYLDFEVNTEIENNNIITNDDYYDLTTKNDYFGEVNKVIIGMKDVDGENTTLVDSDSNTTENFEITLWDNPLTYNQELREKAIVKANKLFGLKYKPVEMTTVGHPWLIGNELLSVVDMEDNVILTYPFDRTISYSGHIKTKIKSQAMSKTDTKYAYEGRLNNLSKSVKNTQIIVDKANQRIDAVVQTQEDLSDTLIPLATSNGVELKLEKSAGQPLVEFELEGNSKQDSYEGKNLFDLGLVYSSYNPSDRGFTLKSVFGSTVISADNLPKIMKPNTTYTIKVISKIIEKPTTIGSNITYDLALYRPESDTHSSFWRDLNTYEKSSKNVGDVTTAYKSFTTPSDLTNLTIRGYSFRGNNDGSTTYTGIGEVEIQEIMLAEGTYDESNFPEFEPYVGGTQSPNPDYPQEITVIEGDLSLKGVGDNLFDFAKLMVLAENITPVNNGYTFSPNSGAYSTGLELETPLTLPISISYKVKNGSGTNFRIRLWYDNGDKQTLSNGSEASTDEMFVKLENITKSGATSIVRIGFDWTTAGSFTVTDFILNAGDTCKDYEPYQETITEIDLQGNFIAKLPNEIEDKLYLNQGHLYLEQNVGKVVLNGTESYYAQTQYMNNILYIATPIATMKEYNHNLISNYFLQGNSPNRNNGIIDCVYKNVLYFGIYTSIIGANDNDSVDTKNQAFRTWLSNNNVTVYYELATPVIHDLGEYSIETLKGNSTIRAISNLQPSNMYCKYIRDIEGLDVFQTKNDMADYYNKFETDSRISVETDSIVEQVGSIASLVDANGKAIETVNNRVTEQITSTQAQIEVVENKVNNGVETLKNSLVTININGIQVSTNTSKINSIMQNNKFAIQDSAGNDLIFIGYDEELGASVSRMDNLTVGNYFVAGVHRQEKFQDEETNEWRTGFFYIGGSE